MKSITTHILIISLAWVTSLSAQVSAVRQSTEAAREELARGLIYEKVDGQVDSAALHYRRVLALHARGLAPPAVAQRAQARLAVLGRDLPSPEPDATANGAPDVTGVAAVARSLQWGPSLARSSPRTRAVDPLRHRQRWFARALQLSPARAVGALEPGWMAMLGQGIDAVRASLGLRGIVYYVAMEKRRARGRPQTPHERLLAALWAEKEQQHFGIAEGRYTELVQLDSTGGIATRLTEWARQGVLRTQSWRHPDPTTAAPAAESE